MKMKILSAPALILALLLVLFLFGANTRRNIQLPGNHSFTSLTGEKLVMSALNGKPVLVTFWATTCSSCIAEIPHLIDLYHRFHPQGLELIAVAMAYDPPNQVVQMAQIKQLPYQVALDIDSKHANAFGGIWATPTTYLIGSDGKIAWKTIGMFEPARLNHRIEELLKLTKD